MLGRMNTHIERTLSRRVAAPLRSAPPMLVAYTVFAIAVTFTDLLLRPLAPESFRSLLVSYTGWGASMFYAFTIFFAIALIYQQKKRKNVRFGITLQLLLSIAWGVYQFFQKTGETFGNPYLTISPWRPVWTVLIPSIWIVLLHSPRMNRFCRQTNEPRAAS